MKKFAGILLSTVMLIAACAGFAGCGKDDPELGNEPTEEEIALYGQFKSLKKAYEAGWITHDDLKSIAFYYNGENDSNYYETMEFHDENDEIVEYVPYPEAEFVPTAMSYENFNQETIEKMKSCYGIYISNQSGGEQSGVVRYYGEYHNRLAVTMYASSGEEKSCVSGGGDPLETFIRYVYRLEDAVFYGNNAKEILIWNPPSVE